MTTTIATTAYTTTIRVRQGDTLDAICWRVFGAAMNNDTIVEQVLSLNPGLADLGDVLPMGTQVLLPVIQSSARTAQRKEVIQLWD